MCITLTSLIPTISHVTLDKWQNSSNLVIHVWKPSTITRLPSMITRIYILHRFEKHSRVIIRNFDTICTQKICFVSVFWIHLQKRVGVSYKPNRKLHLLTYLSKYLNYYKNALTWGLLNALVKAWSAAPRSSLLSNTSRGNGRFFVCQIDLKLSSCIRWRNLP